MVEKIATNPYTKGKRRWKDELLECERDSSTLGDFREKRTKLLRRRARDGRCMAGRRLADS